MQTLANQLEKLSLSLSPTYEKLVELNGGVTFTQLRSYDFFGSTFTFMSPINSFSGAPLSCIQCELKSGKDYLEIPPELFLKFSFTLKSLRFNITNVLFQQSGASSFHQAVARLRETQLSGGQVTSNITGADTFFVRPGVAPSSTLKDAAREAALFIQNEAERCWIQDDDQVMEKLKPVRGLQLLLGD